METCFATPERVHGKELAAEIHTINNSSVVSCLLHTISGSITILDEHRQIVATNGSFLQMLGIEQSSEILGLRPGEALHCIHAHKGPGGCGTSIFCPSCAAVVAFISSLEQDKPVDKKCAITAYRGDKTVDLVLQVKSQPIEIDNKKYLLIFFQDVSQQEQRAALERTFYHDINNMLQMLLGASELLVVQENSELAEIVHQSSMRINNELSIQRSLSLGDKHIYQPHTVNCTTVNVLQELQRFFKNHPVARGKNITYQNTLPDFEFHTDASLLSRILCNMTTNALEATSDSGTVKVWIEEGEDQIIFCVWNEQEMAPEAVHRMFQRNFSTKQGSGRGIGTFSMKLFGEDILGGKVTFTTSANAGTVFKFSHPLGGS